MRKESGAGVSGQTKAGDGRRGVGTTRRPRPSTSDHSATERCGAALLCAATQGRTGHCGDAAPPTTRTSTTRRDDETSRGRADTPTTRFLPHLVAFGARRRPGPSARKRRPGETSAGVACLGRAGPALVEQGRGAAVTRRRGRETEGD